MFWSIFVIILVLFSIAVFSIVFLPTILEVLINGAIIYFILLKASADITKRNRLKLYLFSGIISLFFMLISGNFLPLWSITTWTVLTMFIVLLVIFVKPKQSIKD